MRKILAGLLLAFSVVPAGSAAEPCEVRAELAREIMASRQAGIPAKDVVRLAKDAGSYSDEVQALILSAYERPRFQTEKHQQREIVEFENEAYVACVRKGH